MKKFYNVLAVLAIPSFLIFYSFSSGSPGGQTGSPGDGNTNCTGCHMGEDPINADNLISTNIPVEGYTPGETYTITVSGSHAGVGKFGFEVTAENSIGDKKGSFAISDPDRTNFTSPGTSVTHTFGGTAPQSTDSTSWTMMWTAPSSGSGEIRFYAAVNAANGENGNNGDIIYLTMKSVQENLFTSLAENSLQESVKLFPNPATSVVNLKVPEQSNIRVIDLMGRIVMEKIAVSSTEVLNIETLEQGIYFVRVDFENESYSTRLLKN